KKEDFVMLPSLALIILVGLALGLPCGQLVLSVAVLAILITAPLGALGMDLTYRKLLTKA
ncbi:sodium:proton antiporter, partial [Gemmiger formicilis]|nr:sodium:proton antiporter [Gemmiger formicilis]